MECENVQLKVRLSREQELHNTTVCPLIYVVVIFDIHLKLEIQVLVGI